MKSAIPCVVSKVKDGQWSSCKELNVKEIGGGISRCVTALYPNHADSSDNSNLVIEIMKVGSNGRCKSDRSKG